MSRLIKCVEELHSEYLTEDETYIVTGFSQEHWHFQRANVPGVCATYISSWRVKKALQEGCLIFVD